MARVIQSPASSALCPMCWGYSDNVKKIRLASPGNCGIVDCDNCVRTGRDPLPWTEVIKEDRRYAANEGEA